MTPFSISCTTCGARLKVRDEGAIGQLSLCPKCGSMVMVTPPAPSGKAASQGTASQSPLARPPAQQAPVAEAGARPQDAASPSKSSPQLIVGGASAGGEFDDAAALLADTVDDVPLKSSEPPPIAPPTESMSSIELDPPDAVGSASPLARAGASATAEPESPLEHAKPPSERPVDPSTAGADGQLASLPPPSLQPPPWTTANQAAWQRWGIVAAVVLAAVGLVGGLLVLMQPAPPRGQPMAEGDAVEGAPPAADTGGVASAPSPAGDVDSDNPAAPPDAAPPPTFPGDEDLVIQPTDVNDGGGETTAAVGENRADSPDGIDIEPADGVAPPLFAGPDASGSPPADESSRDETASIDIGLGDFAPFIDAFPLPPALPESARPSRDPDGEPPPKEMVAVRERPEPRAVEVEARLAEKIDGIDAGGAPLARFVELISQLSTIPITLDPAALAQAKARPDSPMSLTMLDASVAEVLAAGLATHGLSYEVRGDRIVVTAAPRGRERLLQANYEVADLAADAAALDELIEHVEALVAPTSWEAGGGEGILKADGGKLAARNTQDAHFELHVFLQRLRVARGLAPRSSFDPAMFALATRTAKAGEKLNTPVRAVFHTERPLTKILDRLEKSASVQLLVDWESLLEAGWPPHATAALIADGVPLAEALDELLAPMELTYRAIDETTIQITSQEALASRAELEFYSVADLLHDGKTPAELIAELQAKLGNDRFAAHGGPFELRYDESSKCLLARLPQMQQRVIEAMLRL